VAKRDPEVSLESERLEQYLEAVTPEQPRVVIQYRSRGVSPWLFFPLIVVIPVAAILVYHRFVVARDRSLESRSRLVTDPAAPATGSRAPEPAPETVASPAVPTPAPGTAPAGPPEVTAKGKTGGSDASPPGTAGAATAAREPGSNVLNASSPTIAANTQVPAPADKAPIEVAKKAGPRLRSILPNPFAAEDPPAPPEPGSVGSPGAGEGGPPTKAADVHGEKPPAVTKETHEKGGETGELLTHAEDVRQGETGRVAEAALPAPQPLPTKQESMQSIAQEAAKKQAEMAAQEDARDSETRARRYEERVKFREELREILRSYGNEAGPEIDKLASRYGYDIDSKKFKLAKEGWKFGRSSVQSKVRLVRSLDLPETVILNFLSDELHLQVRSRNGPRDENEVRIKAAQKLLGYELPRFDSPVRPGGGALRRESAVGVRSKTESGEGPGAERP
jgi:hypothetical protein